MNIRINYKKVLLAFLDILSVALSGLASYAVMSFFGLPREYIKRAMLSTVLSIIVIFLILNSFGVYRALWRSFQPRSLWKFATAALIGAAVSYLSLLIIDKPMYPMFYLLLFVFCCLSTASIRLIFGKSFFAPRTRTSSEQAAKRTLIVGAGRATQSLLQEIKNLGERSMYLPVCIVDDDARKSGDKIYGIPIVGKTQDIPALCSTDDIDLIMFAIPSANNDERKRVLDICYSTGVQTKIIPSLSNLLFDGGIGLLAQVKDIKIEDLLGREPVSFDNKDISGIISGKTIMVTGGGGSIGSEMCRQIMKYNPEKLVIVDIYENNAYDIQQELLKQPGTDEKLVVLISSVRDKDKMRVIFDKYRPQLVFHAAAHKHVPLMEESPEEAVKNNVHSTYNIAGLANEFEVEKFVLISTDKAVNPTNVMGATKRCCEMIVQYFARISKKTDFVAVRFGNVLGSNGSVVPLFKKQIEAGGPVTVTHREITRYFMMIPEAVSLVLRAASMAAGGEIFVLDMGEPVKILSLAEKMIFLSGRTPYTDIPIVFTGLRPGEKLYEELLMSEEGLSKTKCEKIFIGTPIDIDEQSFSQQLSTLFEAADKNDSAKALSQLCLLVPTFKHDVLQNNQRCHAASRL